MKLKFKRSQKNSVLILLLARVFISPGTLFADESDFGAALQNVLAQTAQAQQAVQQKKPPEGESEFKRISREQRLLASKVLPSVGSIDFEDRTGSAFLIDASGLVLTAAHVVLDSDTVKIRFDRMPGAPTVTAKVIGNSKSRDIALLQIQSDRKNWPALKLGDPAREHGENGDFTGLQVFACGNAGGLGVCMSSPGSVQICKQNMLSGYADCIQHGAPSPPGTSGGPLVDYTGQVVGMNHAVHGQFGNLSLATDVEALKKAVAEQKRGQALLDAGIKAKFFVMEGLPTTRKFVLMLSKIDPDSKATDLTAQDLITAIDGVDIPDNKDLFAAYEKIMSGKKPGDKARLSLERLYATEDGKAHTYKTEVEVELDKLTERITADFAQGQIKAQPKEDKSSP